MNASGPPYFPLKLIDADLLTSLLVIIIPFPFGQVNARKWCRGFDAFGLPFALRSISLGS